MLIFDCEIAKPIPTKNEPQIEGIEYCEGWTDYMGMGISVIAAYDYSAGLHGAPRLYSKDNIEDFIVALQDTERVVTFNGKAFDLPLLAEHGIIIHESKHYDLFLEIKAAANAGHFSKGYNLENTCQVNLGIGKASDPYRVPVHWQLGNYGRVFNYALQDIWMMKGLMDMVIAGTPLLDPGNPSRRIFVKPPLQGELQSQ